MYDRALRIMLKLIICDCRNIVTVEELDDFFQRYVASFHVEKVDDDEFEAQEATVEDVVLPTNVVKCLFGILVSIDLLVFGGLFQRRYYLQ